MKTNEPKIFHPPVIFLFLVAKIRECQHFFKNKGLAYRRHKALNGSLGMTAAKLLSWRGDRNVLRIVLISRLTNTCQIALTAI